MVIQQFSVNTLICVSKTDLEINVLAVEPEFTKIYI